MRCLLNDAGVGGTVPVVFGDPEVFDYGVAGGEVRGDGDGVFGEGEVNVDELYARFDAAEEVIGTASSVDTGLDADKGHDIGFVSTVIITTESNAEVGSWCAIG